MAAERYIKEIQHSPVYANEAGEVIEEGDFVYFSEGDQKAYVADPGNGKPILGVVPRRERGDVLREHAQDYTPKQYDVGEGPVPIYQLEEAAELTRDAVTAGVDISQWEAVALDANFEAVPASSADAVTDALGRAVHYAVAGDGVTIRLGL